MSSVTYTTPTFLKALGNLAKENQASNKEFKSKLAAKANRVKQLQRQRKIADQMDKELTKLEQKAAKEQANIAEKQAKKEAKIAEKQAKKEARVVTTDTDSDENVEEVVVDVKPAEKKATKKAKLAKEEVQEKKSKKAIKAIEHNNDRQDIIQILCEKMGHTLHVATAETTA